MGYITGALYTSHMYSMVEPSKCLADQLTK